MKAFSLKAYGRILWREMAEQYTFCIAIFVMLVVMQASLTTMETFQMTRLVTPALGFGMALFMTAIYAAASSALLFTADIDAGTFAFHRTKPIGWLTYLSGKLTWTVLSSLALGIAAWIETGVWQGAFPNSRDASLAFGVCGVGIMEGLAWGLIATMVVRGPLRAVIAGIAMGSLTAYTFAIIHHTVTDGGSVLVTTAYHQAAELRLIVAAVVLVTGVLLARVWYGTGQPLGRGLLLRLPHGETHSVAAPGQWSSYERPCRGRSIRLLWQAWRQVRSPVVIYWSLSLAAFLWVAIFDYAGMGKPGSPFDPAPWVVLAMIGFSSILAGYTFGPDQKARFLQLARDGVSPREIWLSRLAVMASVLLPPALIVLGLLWRRMGDTSQPATLGPIVVFLVAVGGFSVLVIGQMCSMFVRSRIIALLAAPVMVACFAFWGVMVVLAAGLDWKLGVAPMLAALLIGSRLLAGARLRQDNSWRALRVPALLVVVAIVFSCQTFAYHRANEIRPYDSAHPADDLLAASTRGRVLANRRTLSRLDKHPRQWIEESLTPREDDTFSRDRYRFAQPWRENAPAVQGWTHHGWTQTTRVVTYEEMLVEEMDLNRTLREVTREADLPDERLRACVEFLEDWAGKRSSHADWLAAAYQSDLLWLQHGVLEKESHTHGRYNDHHEPPPLRYRWLSFERQRMLKLLDRAFRIAAERAAEYEQAVINDQVGVQPPLYNLVTGWDILPYDPSRGIWYQSSSDTMFYSIDMHRFRLLNSVTGLRWIGDDPFYSAEVQRRGTILYLALRMHYNDHGRLPESLDELVEGEYLDRLPVVPITRKSFYYEPEGAEEKLVAAIKSVNDPEQRRYWLASVYAPELFEHDDSAPFLWCPSRSIDPMDPSAGPGWFIDLDFVE